MSFKYLGEAVVLLGIAYSIMRWVFRTLGEVDKPATRGGVDRTDADDPPTR